MNIVSLLCCLCFAELVVICFLVWLVRTVSRVARSQGAAAVKEAPPIVQAALQIAEAVTGLSAQEQAEQLAEEQARLVEIRQILLEDYGIQDPSEVTGL